MAQSKTAQQVEVVTPINFSNEGCTDPIIISKSFVDSLLERLSGPNAKGNLKATIDKIFVDNEGYPNTLVALQTELALHFQINDYHIKDQELYAEQIKEHVYSPVQAEEVNHQQIDNTEYVAGFTSWYDNDELKCSPVLKGEEFKEFRKEHSQTESPVTLNRYTSVEKAIIAKDEMLYQERNKYAMQA